MTNEEASGVGCGPAPFAEGATRGGGAEAEGLGGLGGAGGGPDGAGAGIAGGVGNGAAGGRAGGKAGAEGVTGWVGLRRGCWRFCNQAGKR